MKFTFSLRQPLHGPSKRGALFQTLWHARRRYSRPLLIVLLLAASFLLAAWLDAQAALV